MMNNATPSHQLDLLFNYGKLPFIDMHSAVKTLLKLATFECHGAVQCLCADKIWRDMSHCSKDFNPNVIFRLNPYIFPDVSQWLTVPNYNKHKFHNMSELNQKKLESLNQLCPKAIYIDDRGFITRHADLLGKYINPYLVYAAVCPSYTYESPFIVTQCQEPCIGPTSTEDLLMKNDLQFKDMTVEHRSMMLYLARIEGRQFEYRNLASTCRSFVKLMNEPAFASNYVYRLLPKEKPKPVVKEHISQVVCSQLSLPVTITIKFTSIDGVFQDDAKIVSTKYDNETTVLI